MKFLHRPAILAIFDADLNLTIDAFQNLHTHPSPLEVAEAAQLILDVLENEYPYMLVYRYGAQEAERMKLGLMELLAIAQWASEEDLALEVVLIRRYYSVAAGKEVVQVEQEKYGVWI